MKPLLTLAVLLVATPVFAQQTGVSRPPDTVVEDLPPAASVPGAIHSAKPSAAVPDVPEQAAPVQQLPEGTVSAQEVYQPYQPAGVSLHTRANSSAPDPDAGIVTEVPRNANELPVGTMLRARLRNGVATDATPVNTPFAADVTENVVDSGRVVIPAGSTVEGTITEVRGGRRIRGAALIHFQVQRLILPDGTREPLGAAVVDTDQFADTKVDAEGNIVRKDHAGATLAAMSLATGGAAAAGGVLGGAPGALVGAAVGAGVSTVWWLKQDRQTHLPQETLLVFGLTQPLPVGARSFQPEFSRIPATQPSVAVTTPAMQQSAPAYVEPRAFVPTN